MNNLIVYVKHVQTIGNFVYNFFKAKCMSQIYLAMDFWLMFFWNDHIGEFEFMDIEWEFMKDKLPDIMQIIIAKIFFLNNKAFKGLISKHHLRLGKQNVQYYF